MKSKPDRPPIAPGMKVGDFLKNYPELENALLEMSPAFAKLKNPVLRRTVARVATLGQAAAIGNISVSDMINRLRKAAGSDETYRGADAEAPGRARPSWLDNPEISESFDARPMIERGEQPLSLVVRKLNELEIGKTLVLVTPFFPAPIVDKAKAMGFDVWSDKTDGTTVRSYFSRASR